MKAAFKERAMKRDSMVKEDTLESCIRCREGMMSVQRTPGLFFLIAERQ